MSGRELAALMFCHQHMLSQAKILTVLGAKLVELAALEILHIFKTQALCTGIEHYENHRH